MYNIIIKAVNLEECKYNMDCYTEESAIQKALMQFYWYGGKSKDVTEISVKEVR